MKVQLKELLKAMTVLELDGRQKNQEITGLAYDARRIQPGMVYFDMPGNGHDGTSEIELALERGASAVVCRPGGMRQRVTTIEVPDPRLALAEAATALYRRPSSRVKTVLVTGRCGQSYLAALLRQILEGAGIRTALIGSERHEIGQRTFPAGRQYPEASDIQYLLAQSIENRCQVCVIEAPLEEVVRERFFGTDFDVVVLTPRSNGFEGAERFSLLSALRNAASQKASCTVLQRAADRPRMRFLFGDIQLSYGFEDGSEVAALNLECSADSSRFVLQAGGTRFGCKVPLVGRYSVSHLLGAVGAALCLDVGTPALQRSFRAIKPVAGNVERIHGPGDIPVYVDQARTAEELQEVLPSLREIRERNLVLVLGREQATTGKARYDLGVAAGNFAEHIVLTSDNPGREPVEQICSAIAQGIEQTGHANYHFQPDRAKAIGEALALARPGDMVLIAGKGARTHQELAHTIVPFDDREYALEYLTAASWTSSFNPRVEEALATVH